MKDNIKRELDEMIEQDIIVKIQEGEPTAWVNSLVYRGKANGRLGLCLDPKDFNETIRREYRITFTLEDILPKLSGAKLFSIVDVKCGYWNIVLDEESSFLTTFNSPYGRYKFKRKCRKIFSTSPHGVPLHYNKSSISDQITWTYFDPKEATVLQVGAFTKGVHSFAK